MSLEPHLLYSRQFILGPQLIYPSGPWENRVVAGGRFVVQAHIHLEITQARSENCELTLLGYMLDPFHPEQNNAEILEALIEFDWTKNHAELTQRLGGRWVLIVALEHETVLFHDAIGARQVFYSDDSTKETWCASQVSHIALALGIQADESARIHPLTREIMVKDDPQYWWPGEATSYRGIKRLLPNHELCLSPNFSIKRIWPHQSLPTVDYDDTLEQSANLLTGQLLAANHRFKLALPITAGLDSRAILAATRKIAKETWYYTIKIPPLKRWLPDALVPYLLSKYLSLDYHWISIPARMSDEFAKVYLNNAEPAHLLDGRIAEGLTQQFPSNHVSISSLGSEIMRCAYYERPETMPRSLNGKKLANWYFKSFTHSETNTLIEDEITRWLANIQTNTFNVQLLDLYYWEVRVGSWAASGVAEWDLIHEALPLFSNRLLIETMLAVDIQKRQDPEYEIYFDLMKKMWPQVLWLPINPHKQLSKAWKSIKENFL